MFARIQTLLISPDEGRAAELEGALRELPEDWQLILQATADRRRGIEHALDRGVGLVLVELEDDPRQTLGIVQEIASSAPELPVVVLYRPSDGGGTREEGILIELMRAGVSDFLRLPLSGIELEGLLRRRLGGGRRTAAPRGQVLSFLGTKGGVGKSTVAINVACALARQGAGDVLVVDASLQHGTVAELLDLEPTTTLLDAIHQLDRLDGTLLRTLALEHHTGLHVLAAPRNAIEASEVGDGALARVLSIARQNYSHVIVDTFPLLEPVTLAVLDVSDLIHVVLNDFIPTVLGTVELLGVIDRLGFPPERIRVVLNHTHPGYRGQLPASDVATRLARAIDYQVPFSRQVLAATNSGDPHILSAARWRGFPRAIRRIARQTAEVGPRTEAASPAPDGEEQAGIGGPFQLEERGEEANS